MLCFILGSVAAATRQMALGPTKGTWQVIWSSVYSGFTALATSLALIDYGRASAAGVVSASIVMGLTGTEAYNVVRTVILDSIRRALTALPKGPDEADHADPKHAG